MHIHVFLVCKQTILRVLSSFLGNIETLCFYVAYNLLLILQCMLGSVQMILKIRSLSSFRCFCWKQQFSLCFYLKDNLYFTKKFILPQLILNFFILVSKFNSKIGSFHVLLQKKSKDFQSLDKYQDFWARKTEKQTTKKPHQSHSSSILGKYFYLLHSHTCIPW